jgi:hypothetical protein
MKISLLTDSAIRAHNHAGAQVRATANRAVPAHYYKGFDDNISHQPCARMNRSIRMNAGFRWRFAGMEALHNSSKSHERVGDTDERLAIWLGSSGGNRRLCRVMMKLKEMLVISRQCDIARLGISHRTGIFDGDRAVANDFALDPFCELL